MIKENINITFTGGETSFEAEGQIIIPSQVMTATPQDEEVDLEKAPNVLIKITDEAARSARSLSSEYKKIKAEFDLGDKTYTMNVSLINSSEDYAVLQYCDGMTAEEAEHTFEFDGPIIETHYNLMSGITRGMSGQFIYDEKPVPAADMSFGPLKYHNITVGEPTSFDITLTPKTTFPEISTGIYVDTLTATYKGMTAEVFVELTITSENVVIPDNTFYGELTSDIHNETIGSDTITLDSYVMAKNNDDLKLRTQNMTFDGDKYKFLVGNDNIQYYKLDDGKVFESLRFVELTPEYAQAFLQEGSFEGGTFTQDVDDLIWTADANLETSVLYINFTDVMEQVRVVMTCKMITVTEKERSTEHVDTQN